MGSTNEAPLLRTLLTSDDTGWTVSNVSGAGSSSPDSDSRSSLVGSSHAAHADCGRITGIRSWIGAIVPLAVVVITVALCNQSVSGPAALSRHADHSPATASGSPSRRWMNCGCFAGLPALVSGPPGWPA